MEIFNIIVQATKNLRLAPPVYKYGLTAYFVVAVLIVIFSFRKLSKHKNHYFSIFYRSLIFSLLFSPTLLVGGGAAAITPASFAIVVSIIFISWQALVSAIVPITVVLVLMFSVWAILFRLSGYARNT